MLCTVYKAHASIYFIDCFVYLSYHLLKFVHRKPLCSFSPINVCTLFNKNVDLPSLSLEFHLNVPDHSNHASKDFLTVYSISEVCAMCKYQNRACHFKVLPVYQQQSQSSCRIPVCSFLQCDKTTWSQNTVINSMLFTTYIYIYPT